MIVIMTKSLFGYDLQIVRRSNGVGQSKVKKIVKSGSAFASSPDAPKLKTLSIAMSITLILIVILMVKPTGLFTRRKERVV